MKTFSNPTRFQQFVARFSRRAVGGHFQQHVSPPVATAAQEAGWRIPVLSSLAWAIACVVSVTVVLYWRRPDAFYNPQLWAEDGRRFFTDAYSWGASTLTVPIAGYFHALPRLIAWLGSWLPIRYVPHLYAFASWALLVFIIAYLFSPRFSFGNGIRFLLGFALVATTADNEVFFNLSNWPTLTSLVWLLLIISNEPHSRRQTLFDVVVLALAGLNSPYVICLWPLFLLRWRVRRTRHSLHLFLLSLVVAVIQVWNMPSRPEVSAATELSPLLLDAVIYRFGYLFLGDQVYQVPLTTFTRLGGLALFFGCYGYLFWQAIVQKNWPQLTILAGGSAAAVLSLYVLRALPMTVLYTAGRHFYIPAVTMAWTLLLSSGRWKWLPLGLMFGAFLFLTPGSKNQVLSDLDWAGHTASCAGIPRCRIPIHPIKDPPTWFAWMHKRGFAVPPMQTGFTASFGGLLELLGYDVAQSDSALSLNLVWRATSAERNDYKFFVYLFDPNHPTTILAQVDEMPLDWQHPTSRWLDREVVVDRVELPLEGVQPGQYRLAVGWYDDQAPQMPRLEARNAQGQVWQEDQVILPVTILVP